MREVIVHLEAKDTEPFVIRGIGWYLNHDTLKELEELDTEAVCAHDADCIFGVLLSSLPAETLSELQKAFHSPEVAADAIKQSRRPDYETDKSTPDASTEQGSGASTDDVDVTTPEGLITAVHPIIGELRKAINAVNTAISSTMTILGEEGVVAVMEALADSQEQLLDWVRDEWDGISEQPDCLTEADEIRKAARGVINRLRDSMKGGDEVGAN